jgi:hypothetical protein
MKSIEHLQIDFAHEIGEKDARAFQHADQMHALALEIA